MDDDTPLVDDVFADAPAPPQPRRLPNSPLLPNVTPFPQGMVRPAKKNPLDVAEYPEGVEGLGSIEISENGTPLQILTVSREHGRDLSPNEMMMKYQQGDDFGAFDSPEAATAHSRELSGGEDEPEDDTPNVDDVFGGIDDNWVHRMDRRAQQMTYRVFDAFGYSGAEGFGKEPVATPSTVLDPEFEKWLRDTGVFVDYTKGQGDVARGIFEGVFKGVAAGAVLAQRAGAAAIEAPIGAFGQFLEEIGFAPRGREQLAGLAADPGTAMVLGPFGEFTALSAMANARRAANLHVDLSTARANGVLAEGEAGFFGAKPVTPENAQTRVEAAQAAGIAVPEPLPMAPDIHVLARRVAPAATERFDALRTEQQAHQQIIQSIIAEREALPEVVAVREEIARIQGEPHEIPEVVPTEAAPLSEEEMGNIFLRPQPEDVPQPTLPAPPTGPVTELPIVERQVFDEATLRAEDAKLNQELRGLPRGGRQASDRLARLSTVERSLGDETITRDRRLELLRRRDELLTDTTPEKLASEAAPLERRRAIQAQRETIAERLGALQEERAKKRAAAISEPRIPVTPEALAAAPQMAQTERLAAAEARLEAALNKSSPELDAARAALQAARVEQMSLLPDVLGAYRQAAEMIPPEQKAVEAVVATSEGKPFPSLKDLEAAESAETAELAKLGTPEVPGVDVAIERAAQRKTVGPERPPGTVRFYHGGVTTPQTGGPRWVSPDFAYARDYRDGATTYYVDLPVGHPMEVAARTWDELDAGTNAVGNWRNIELPEDIAKLMKPVGEVTAAERVTPPRTPSGAGPQLRAVEGTGPTKTRGLSEHVEASAIENELTETFGDLPEYEQVSMFDQAVKASTFLAEKPEDAMAVAMGLKAPPRGLLPESVFVAVEKAATAAGDVETLRQLATESRLTTAATTMGQRIRTLGERDRLSPVAAIQEVQDARMAALERRNASAINDAVKEIKATVRANAPKKADWATFINSITCAE